MAPLITLVGTAALLSVLGLLGVRRLRPWPVALRGGLAAMFTVTGTAHFVGLRDTLIAMVPPALPAPELLVTVTGVLELAGAAGLLWHRTAPWAAAGLTLMLVAMFPANVYAITEGVPTGLTESLPVRTAMQAVFVAATTAVLVHYVHAWHGRRRQAPAERRPVPRA
ncbi:DoxX family membrane protein [Nocardiopsis exhalans]|uniref:DoxX family membrane protein n=1 Tax=Nocardiopsis exhalans TaxID=163604 RepID=A0ABY5DEI0_9ACTN|nr:DoxX family membrane protein [Nocardiopsis exhalans]USY21507.1 DoxX family membrane protein [Nocardiopsis exhalans]